MIIKYKAGDIIFLTKRINKKPYQRWFISHLIAVFSKKKEQYLEQVKVHSAIIYEKTDILFVREMDKYGDRHFTLSEYFKKFSTRVEILRMNYNTTPAKLEYFNKTCQYKHVKYDFINTFVWQAIKGITSKYFGKNTGYKRMCAEDVQRQFNILEKRFKTPEKTSPQELYDLCL